MSDSITRSPVFPGESLEGRVAVVTGASSGIGRAVALALMAHGAKVAGIARRLALLDALADAGADARCGAYQTDVTDMAAMEATAGHIAGDLGPVDLVVAAAGDFLPGRLVDMAGEDWERMVSVNVAGVLNTVRAYAPALAAAAAAERPADLVLISSVNAVQTGPGLSVYAATKAAVTKFGEGVRSELGPAGVRVTVIEPGLVDTEILAHPREQSDREDLAALAADVGLLDAAEVAQLVAFLLTRRSGFNVPRVMVLPTRQA